jgi:phage-related protein
MNPTRQTPSSTTNARLGNLETAVAGIASEVSAFIKESHEHRERIERDQTAIWQAVKEQGDRFTAAVDRISTRGALSWPVVVITISMILGLITGIAVVAEKVAEARLRQHEIRMDYIEKIEVIERSHLKELMGEAR